MARQRAVANVVAVNARGLRLQEARRRTGLSEEEWRASVAPYIQDLVASGRYPAFNRRVVDAQDLDADRQFEFGLDSLLAGMGVLVARNAT